MSTLLALLCAMQLAAAQDAAPQDAAPRGAPAPPAQAPAERTWPPAEDPEAPSAATSAKLERALPKLRNENDAWRAKAEAEVIAFGRPAIYALEAAAHTDKAWHQAALVNCLAALVDARDRLRVAAALQSEQVVLRRYAARAAGRIAHPDLLAALPARLADADELVAAEAALSLVANGRSEGEARVVKAYMAGDKERALAALAGVVGVGNHEPIAALLAIDPQFEKRDPTAASALRLAAVEILHAVGDGPARALLVRTLGDPHNLVQRAAIDALRDLLEGSGPLQTISTFDQIKEVERLRALAAAAP